MNLAHRWLCRSARWKSAVEQYILPWTLEGLELGAELLEIGPGPGITTELLYLRVARLTCMEINAKYARSLSERMKSGNVAVVCGDASAMSIAPNSFDAAVCFTMLHHVASPPLQDKLIAEVERVLRPGGIFAGVDSLSSRAFRLLHLFDTMTVVDPATFPARLRAAGFEDARVDVNPYAFRFRARKAQPVQADIQ